MGKQFFHLELRHGVDMLCNVYVAIIIMAIFVSRRLSVSMQHHNHNYLDKELTLL